MDRRKRQKSERSPANHSDSGSTVSPQQREFEQGSGKLWIIDSAIIIALATVTSYLLALFYEIGFYEYFSIPNYFISLSQTQTLTIAGQLIWIFGIVLLPSLVSRLVGPYISSRTKKLEANRKFRIITSVVYVIFVGAAGYYFFPLWRSNFLDSLIILKEPINRLFLILILAVASIPWLSDRVRLVVLAFTLVIAIPGFRQIGRYEAGKWGNFLVVKELQGTPTGSEAVGLRIYGEYLLAVPFDRENKEVEKTLLLIKMSDIAQKPLTVEQVGPLRAKP